MSSLPWERTVHPTTERIGKALWATEGTGTPGVHTFPLGSGAPEAAPYFPTAGKATWTPQDGGNLFSTVNETPPLERGM